MIRRNTHATIATDIDANVTDICNHAKNVRSFAKKTFGSTLTGTLRGFGSWICSYVFGLRKRPLNQLKKLELPSR